MRSILSPSILSQLRRSSESPWPGVSAGLSNEGKKRVGCELWSKGDGSAGAKASVKADGFGASVKADGFGACVFTGSMAVASADTEASLPSANADSATIAAVAAETGLKCSTPLPAAAGCRAGPDDTAGAFRIFLARRSGERGLRMYSKFEGGRLNDE